MPKIHYKCAILGFWTCHLSLFCLKSPFSRKVHPQFPPLRPSLPLLFLFPTSIITQPAQQASNTSVSCYRQNPQVSLIDKFSFEQMISELARTANRCTQSCCFSSYPFCCEIIISSISTSYLYWDCFEDSIKIGLICPPCLVNKHNAWHPACSLQTTTALITSYPGTRVNDCTWSSQQSSGGYDGKYCAWLTDFMLERWKPCFLWSLRSCINIGFLRSQVSAWVRESGSEASVTSCSFGSFTWKQKYWWHISVMCLWTQCVSHGDFGGNVFPIGPALSRSHSTGYTPELTPPGCPPAVQRHESLC